MGVIEDLDKAIALVNSRQSPESYILVCNPAMAEMIEQFGDLPEHITLQKSPYCNLDRAYLVKDEQDLLKGWGCMEWE